MVEQDDSEVPGAAPTPSALEAAVIARAKAIPEGQVSETARKAGIGSQALFRIRRGERSDIRLSTLERLNAALGGPDLAALVAGASTPAPQPSTPNKGDDWFQLPKVAFTAAGSPIHDVIRKEDTVWYAFHRSWVKRKLSVMGSQGEGGEKPLKDEERLIVVQVDKKHLGESMIPTVRPGALLVVDRGPKGQGISRPEDLRPGRLYLVNVDGGLTVKRVLPHEGAVILVSDNPDRTAYPPRVLRMGRTPLQKVVIGRVIWIGHEED